MISLFRGEYAWLSNFADVKIEYKGRIYPSVEHAYISAKVDDEGWKELCSTKKYRAGDLKKVSKDLDIRKDWDDVKVYVMYDLLVLKFGKEPFRSKLLETGDMELVEGNWWGDVFWGVDMNTDTGQNVLGRLLMKIRTQIKNGMFI
jgi:ribA/ribD-fused uncharacterized protein